MKLYQAETHCHTQEVSPCSRIPAKYLVEGMVEAGYRYMFLTDHYHSGVFEHMEPMRHMDWQKKIDHFMSGYLTAKKYAQGTDLKVMMAMELCIKKHESDDIGSDFLVYGMSEEFLRDHPQLYYLQYQEFFQLMDHHGFMVFQAHPYRYNLQPIEPVCYHGIEVVNTHPRHVSQNQKAIKFALDHDLYLIAGSDIHTDEDIGRGGIMLPGDIESTMDLVQYYKENGSPELIVTFGA